MDGATQLATATAQFKNLSTGSVIIFDNVDDMAQIEPYLPNVTATPHLLATSRIDLSGFHALGLNLLN